MSGYFHVTSLDDLPLDEEVIMVFLLTNKGGVQKYTHHVGECILVNNGQSRLVIAGGRMGRDWGDLVAYGRFSEFIGEVK